MINLSLPCWISCVRDKGEHNYIWLFVCLFCFYLVLQVLIQILILEQQTLLSDLSPQPRVFLLNVCRTHCTRTTYRRLNVTPFLTNTWDQLIERKICSTYGFWGSSLWFWVPVVSHCNISFLNWIGTSLYSFFLLIWSFHNFSVVLWIRSIIIFNFFTLKFCQFWCNY